MGLYEGLQLVWRRPRPLENTLGKVLSAVSRRNDERMLILIVSMASGPVTTTVAFLTEAIGTGILGFVIFALTNAKNSITSTNYSRIDPSSTSNLK